MTLSAAEQPALARALVIRPAEQADIPRLMTLYAQLIPEEKPAPEDMAEALERILAAPDHGTVVVAELNGVVVATCQLVIYDNLVRCPRRKAMVDSVVVDAAYRFQGIGKAMMRWSMEHLIAAGCGRVIVSTGHTRTVAHKMYDHAGFEQAGLSYIWAASEDC